MSWLKVPNSSVGVEKLMKKLTAAEKRYLDNATLIAASRLIFQSIERSGVPTKTLKEIATTTSGGTPNRQTSTYYGGSIPWIKSGELNNGLITEADEFLTREGLENSSAKIYPKGTLVIALYGATVGKVGILDFDSASNQAVCAVTPSDKDICQRYLFWFLRNKRQDFLDTSFGGAQPNISQKILRQTNLPVPSPQLQKAIADFLDLIEYRQVKQSLSDLPKLPEPLSDIPRIVARIEELAAKVEEARELRSQTIQTSSVTGLATARQIFSNLDSLKTELKEWLDPERHGIQTGPFGAQLGSSDFTVDGYPVITIGNVQFDGLKIDGLKFVSEEKSSTLNRYFAQEGDLLFARMGTVGRCCIVPKKAEGWIFNYHLIRVALDKKKVEPRFIHWLIQASPDIGDYLSVTTRGATRKGVNSKIVGNLPCRIPSLEKQKQIVTYLDGLQTKINTLSTLQTQTATELDALLPAILDKAFKGEL